MQDNNLKLDFVGIGAQRSATTWIAECLREHPEICMAEPKELNFFGGDKYEFGLPWYRKHFNPSQKTKVFGEFTSTYLYSEKAAKRIKKNFPNAKIIICLRHPVERFISHILAQGKEVDFLDVLQERKDALSHGLYYGGVKNYGELFGENNVLVLAYKDIFKNPQDFMSLIYDFLGAESSFVARSTFAVINPSRKYKMVFLKKIIDSVIDFLESVRAGVYVLQVIKLSGGRKLFYAFDSAASHPIKEKKIPEDLREKLEDYYREDIEKLEKLLKRDLSFWK